DDVGEGHRRRLRRQGDAEGRRQECGHEYGRRREARCVQARYADHGDRAGLRSGIVPQGLITPLDTSDDRLVARVHELLLACHMEASPRVPYRDEAETASYLRHPPPFERRPLWIAGDVEGFARLGIIDGSRSGWLELAVAQSSR